MTAPENPVLVRFRRGATVESIHRGSIALADANGVRALHGDVERPVFWRSAAKPFQAAAALAAGVAERFGLERSDLAILAASHNGEDRHVATVRALLARAGIAERELQCGPHPSIQLAVALDKAARGLKPEPIASNCSGKHAGMLLLAKQLGAPLDHYLDPRHPAQRAVWSAIAECSEFRGAEPPPAVDGCSAPTWPLPLANLAIAFRHLANPSGPRAPALQRIRDAMIAEPFLVAGTGRFDTVLMEAAGGAIVSKVGAEGVIACGVVGRNVGIAIKIDDGAARAYEPLLLALLAERGFLDAAASARLESAFPPRLRNFAGIEYGEVEVLR